jgi:pSer/pThr/pTyr-binding forkhead associated (FHA) protein
MSTFKLIHRADPRNSHEIQKARFMLGRSKECDIVLDDPHISRRQARVALKDRRYCIENIGRNPIYVNGRCIPRQFLRNGDEIVFGKTKYLLRIEDRSDRAAGGSTEEKTMLLNSRPVQPAESLGPRIVCTSPAGRTSIHPLVQPKLIIGRSQEADVRLNDPLVSRRHCVIEKKKAHYVARNLSASNPLFVNDRALSSHRLLSGDQLKIGSFSIAFISDRPSDAAKPPSSMAGRRRTLIGNCLRITLAFALAAAAYCFYLQGYLPWRTHRAFESIREQMASGDHPAAQSQLLRLLKSGLDPTQKQLAGDLMAKTALAVSRQKEQSEGLQAAKAYLTTYLMEHGGGEEAQHLWDRLDYYRLHLGKLQEAEGNPESALQHFAAVRTTSLYYPEAQKCIRQIWLSQQQRHLQEDLGPKGQDQALAYLIREAEGHFAGKRYLTPVNRNAYAVYRAVLALEPGHPLALDRINQMKAFYLDRGNACLQKEQWHRALTYFERYRLIDPEETGIKEKIEFCRQKLGQTENRKPSPAEDPSPPKNKEQSKQQAEIKRLLESSGEESSWIMQYLFEEPDGEKDTQTPW